MTFRGVTTECRGDCRGGCDGITRGMPQHPPRRAMKYYATPRDAVGVPWYAMGGTMAMPRKIQIVLDQAPSSRQNGGKKLVRLPEAPVPCLALMLLRHNWARSLGCT